MFRGPFGCTLGGRGFDSSRIVSRTGLNIPPGSRLRRGCGSLVGKNSAPRNLALPRKLRKNFLPSRWLCSCRPGVALLTRRVSQENPPCPAGPVRDRARGGSSPGTLIGGTGGGSLARSGPNCYKRFSLDWPWPDNHRKIPARSLQTPRKD